MKKSMFLLSGWLLLALKVAAIDSDFLRQRELKARKTQVSICHYDARRGLFKKKIVKENQFKKYIGNYGPPDGYKDMTVADANALPGSKDCKCVFGYTGDGLNCEKQIANICHYQDDLGKFKEMFIPVLQLEDFIGIYGPADGCKDMTVEDANALAGSHDCECMFGYAGSGLNCKETPNEGSAMCNTSHQFSALGGVSFVITYDMETFETPLSAGSFYMEYGVTSTASYAMQVFQGDILLYKDVAVSTSASLTLLGSSISTSTTIKLVFSGTNSGEGGIYVSCPR